MTDATFMQGAMTTADRGRLWVVLYLATTGVVLLLMMLALFLHE